MTELTEALRAARETAAGGGDGKAYDTSSTLCGNSGGSVTTRKKTTAGNGESSSVGSHCKVHLIPNSNFLDKNAEWGSASAVVRRSSITK